MRTISINFREVVLILKEIEFDSFFNAMPDIDICKVVTQFNTVARHFLKVYWITLDVIDYIEIITL